jgi:hypothetical protein
MNITKTGRFDVRSMMVCPPAPKPMGVGRVGTARCKARQYSSLFQPAALLPDAFANSNSGVCNE